MTDRVLDATIIKNLLNHIYEKRKATAFQIEGITKAALAQNDSTRIYQIITTLTELSNSGPVVAKMGALTALGSVSVALGLFAIAYFLEDIVRPIFATFRDSDARVRYYACESLYNIAKIARGEILLYFNEVFDILCLLVTDTESSVKNAADILDRLIKDIVSAKSTSYVSILHQPTDGPVQSHVVRPTGDAVQCNHPQNPSKAFLLPRFIPTLLERMYTIEPFAKKFLLGWLELFDDIPTSKFITFLPSFLEPLIRFLMNRCPSDVRIETQNLLHTFLKEMEASYKVHYEVRRAHILRERQRQRDGPDAAAVPESALSSDHLVTALGNTRLASRDALPALVDASIKSASTTIVRKPNDDAEDVLPAPADTSDSAEFVIGQDIFIDYVRTIPILLSFLRTVPPKTPSEYLYNDLSGESRESWVEIQLTVLRWLLVILRTSPTSFSKYVPDCVSIILRNIALTDELNDVNLRAQFVDFDRALRSYLIRLHECSSADSADDEVNESTIQGLNREAYEEFLELHLAKTLLVVLNEYLLVVNELARLNSLDWFMFLYSHYRSSFFTRDDDGASPKFKLDLTALLRSCVDASKEVVAKVLALAAQISEDNKEFFKDFIVKLIVFFERHGTESMAAADTLGAGSHEAAGALSREKIEFIVRRLCVLLSAENIFKLLSEVLVSFEPSNADFLGNIVVTINNILLTMPELLGLRRDLRNFDLSKNDDWALFSTLFQCWSYNVPSALSLCLLTSNYELAYLIIKNLTDTEVSFQLLAQLDVLVQLLESHIFLKLRLQLLEPDKFPYLYKTLYGILMIMPQSSTYSVLQNRLSTLTLYLQNLGTLSTTPTPGIAHPGATTPTFLSAKRKRIHELADTFVKMHEEQQAASLRKTPRDDYGRADSIRLASTALPSAESRPLMQDYFGVHAESKR